MREATADTKASDKGGEGDAPGTGGGISLEPVEQPMVKQDVLLQPMEAHGEQRSTCSLCRTLPEQLDA